MDASIKEHAATLSGDYREGNKQGEISVETFEEIKKYGAEGIDSLMELLDSQKEDEVSIQVATFCLKHRTEKCIYTLNRIAKKEDLLGFEAQQALLRWEEGNWNIG